MAVCDFFGDWKPPKRGSMKEKLEESAPFGDTELQCVEECVAGLVIHRVQFDPRCPPTRKSATDLFLDRF